MGVNFVVIIENCLEHTQEEVNAAFGVQRFTLRSGEEEVMPEWECFTWKDRSYASWLFTPRYFEPEAGDPMWEALRKYLVRARDFFGADEVLVSNDVLCTEVPEEGEDFWLPLPLDETLLAEPDREQFPELAGVRELEGLTW